MEEASSISVETLQVQSVQVEDTLTLIEIHNEDPQSNSFLNMRITGPWCDAVTDMDYCCEFGLKIMPIQTMMCGSNESSNQYQSEHKQQQ